MVERKKPGLLKARKAVSEHCHLTAQTELKPLSSGLGSGVEQAITFVMHFIDIILLVTKNKYILAWNLAIRNERSKGYKIK
jgi:hypothetical protein